MLATTRIGRLGCALNGQPYVVPIHFDFDGHTLYGFATMGKKIEWMRQNPLVCLEIEELTTRTEWATVVVLGRYEELPDTPAYEDARRVAEFLFQKHPVWWEPASIPLVGSKPRERILFRIQINRLSGRRAVPDEVQSSHILDAPSKTGRWRSTRRFLDRLLGRP